MLDSSQSAHLNEPIPGVMIEQGMLGKNDAARSYTTGNEAGYDRPLDISADSNAIPDVIE